MPIFRCWQSETYMSTVLCSINQLNLITPLFIRAAVEQRVVASAYMTHAY
jgi:hypothetical protein